MPSTSHTAPEDFASLSERMDYLHALRAGFACLALAVSPWASHPTRESFALVAGACAAYLTTALASEWVRRKATTRGLWVIGGMLIADGLYLAWVTYLTGGTQSPLRFLVYLHIVAVTLLASYRTGLKVALWHTLLFFTTAYGQAAGLLDVREALPMALPGRGEEFARLAALNVTALWGMALGTAAFSSLIERELRRQKVDLQSLAGMASELDRRIDAPQIARILLDRLGEAFGFVRGVVLASPKSELLALASMALPDPGDPPPGTDPVVERAWSRREAVLVKELEPRVDPRLASVIPLARNLLVVPLFAEGQALGIVALEFPARRIRRWTVSMVQQFASHAALALRNAWLLEEVQRMAETDPLTGVANRRVFEAVLEREIARAGRTGQQVSLLILDVDHFKRFNDLYGHPAGDRVLRSLAQALALHSRTFDTVARYGGEEFAVILPECSADECPVVADRLRRLLSEVEAPAPVTVSGGAATFPEHAGDAAGLVEVADAALYESKRAGRDRLSVPVRGRASRASAIRPAD